MAKLPPVRKRSSYADLSSNDLVFALFWDRALGEIGAMREDREERPRVKTVNDMLAALKRAQQGGESMFSPDTERALESLVFGRPAEDVAVKHGKHDQSSHGRRRGGGGGGGGRASGGASPAASAAPAPVTQREWNKQFRRAEADANAARDAYARASAAAGESGLSRAERKRRQDEADRLEGDVRAAQERMNEVSRIPVGPAAPRPSTPAVPQPVTQREWNRQFRTAERNATQAREEYQRASAAAGAPGLRGPQLRAAQRAADEAEQRLRAAQEEMNRISQIPVSG